MNTRHTLEAFCCALASLFPKVGCTVVLTWSIWATLVHGCVSMAQAQHRPVLAVVSGLTSFALYTLCVYTYFRIVRSGAGSPLDFPELRLDDGFETTSHLTGSYDGRPVEPPAQLHMHMISNRSTYRSCSKCKVWKPDRTHHCSSCKQCVLRMDHHCPWFATCIGFRNQKFFVQFLVYVSVYCLVLFCISLLSLYEFFTSEDYMDEYLLLNLVFVCILSVTFFLAVTGFLAFLAWLVLRNTTTLELQEQRWNYRNKLDNSGFQYEFDSQGKQKRLGNIFDLGWRNNWKSIMGPSWVYWLLPIGITSTSLDDTFRNGLNFDIDHEVYDKYCYNAQLQDQLNQQLADYKRRLRMERET